jgi:predicted RNA-binding Zn ribbon-like protein
MMKILDKQALLEKRVAEKATIRTEVFEGDSFNTFNSGNFPQGNPEKVASRGRSITMGSPIWDGSEGHAKIWNAIEEVQKRIRKNLDGQKRVINAAMLPDDLNTLIDLIRIDITRRTLQEADYTDIVGIVRSDPSFNKSVRLDEFLPYGAAFTDIFGNNDAVKLLEHKSGATDVVNMVLRAVGDKSSLQEEIFSSIYSLQRVTDAVARGYTAKRNDLNVLGRMVAKTAASGWHANNQQAADTTSGATEEQLLYNTLVSALKLLYSLKDPQTNKVISTPSVILAIPKGTEWAFQRVINGLSNGGVVGNFAALTQIASIIPYQGDTIYMGKETFNYPGVASGKAYLFVPKVSNFTLVKRGLTMETGMGSVLDLSRQERVWYFVQTEYDTEFFGKSAGLAANTGYAVEITLPTL